MSVSLCLHEVGEVSLESVETLHNKIKRHRHLLAARERHHPRRPVCSVTVMLIYNK